MKGVHVLHKEMGSSYCRSHSLFCVGTLGSLCRFCSVDRVWHILKGGRVQNFRNCGCVSRFSWYDKILK